ncbi:MAG: hypothetical protein LBB58_05380, partial [Cellulomonadaceae bacterium]|nr:hypothetical protein [Cellulomonadaceae bacterium]
RPMEVNPENAAGRQDSGFAHLSRPTKRFAAHGSFNLAPPSKVASSSRNYGAANGIRCPKKRVGIPSSSPHSPNAPMISSRRLSDSSFQCVFFCPGNSNF